MAIICEFLKERMFSTKAWEMASLIVTGLVSLPLGVTAAVLYWPWIAVSFCSLLDLLRLTVLQCCGRCWVKTSQVYTIHCDDDTESCVPHAES